MENLKGITVLVVDDHPVFRSGMRTSLGLIGITNIHEAGNGVEALKQLERHKIDVVFLDIEMPVMGGVQTLEEIRKIYLDIPVITISFIQSNVFVREMYNRGANGYLGKVMSVDELCKCITLILDGCPYFPIEVAHAFYTNLAREVHIMDSSQVDLSPREIQILKLIAEQYTGVNIAKMLGISDETVKKHRQRLIKKTNSKSIVGLTLFAVKNNIYQYSVPPNKM